MASRKPKPKIKAKAGIPQKQRFIDAARSAEADETGEPFTRAIKKIAGYKPKIAAQK